MNKSTKTIVCMPCDKISVFTKSYVYYEFTKSYVFFTSHDYVVRITFFFQCLSLIELNAREDECLVIRVLQEGTKKTKKVGKKNKEEKNVI